ncbi:hypothetical protein [Caulobacter sp. Root487D2Y]|uniref:hypothetical protein n=1 Tax=Caulobacter sp. Root487D2Y TaxID=1736547 RepID=UPI0012E3793A|nr:hypothetical protein [Caulobacter sp. Root487D2Y]
MLQDAVKGLLEIGDTLADSLSVEQLYAAEKRLDALAIPLSEDDVRALKSLLPHEGDTAFGLNWTVLHKIEAAPCWPLWDTLKDERNEWTRMLRLRLADAGLLPPPELGSTSA